MPSVVSVLLSVFHGERPHYLAQTLESLQTQTRQADEIVLVEDGPIGQDLRDTIERYRTVLPITSVVLEQNRGLATALNAGLAVARGDLIARIDSDDVALPERLALQVARFETEGVDVVGGFAIEIDENNVLGKMRRVPTTHTAIVGALWANPMIHPTVMYRREAVRSVGGYNEKIRRGQDYDLWFRLAKAGLIFDNIDQPLIHYRFNANSLRRSSPKEKFQRGLIGFKSSRRLGLPLWKQVACFAPFVRSLLPKAIEKPVYRLMQRFRP